MLLIIIYLIINVLYIFSIIIISLIIIEKNTLRVNIDEYITGE
jgi:hypothetical protein